MTEPPEDDLPPDLTRELRIACIGGAAILVVGYAVMIPLKLHGLSPEISWPRVVVGPAVMAGFLPAMLYLFGRFHKHTVACSFGMLGVIFMLFLIVTLIESLASW